MKFLKDLMEKVNPIFLEDKVKSRSQKGEFHQVILYKDGTSECDCIHGQMNRKTKPPQKECWHKQEMRRILDDEFGYMWSI